MSFGISDGKIVGSYPRTIQDKTFGAIEGTLGFLATYTDVWPAGPKKGKTFVGCLICLNDGAETMHLSLRAETTVCVMLAGYLGDVKPGELIRVETSQGTENERVSMGYIMVFRDGDWVRPAYTSMRGKTDQEKLAFAVSIFGNHAASQSYTPQSQRHAPVSTEGLSAFERFRMALAAAKYPDLNAVSFATYAPIFDQILKGLGWNEALRRDCTSLDQALTPDGWDKVTTGLQRIASGAWKEPATLKELRLAATTAPVAPAADEYDPFADGAQ